MKWFQKEITLPRHPKGIHTITEIIRDAIPEMGQVKIGILNLFIQHTSAALTINENADPDVLVDLDNSLETTAPQDAVYLHTCEGPDDMPAHIKTSLIGTSLTLPVRDGRPLLGVWQGICLCEFRVQAGRRTIIATLHGEVL